MTGSDVTRYYYFNGQRVAMHKNSPLPNGSLTYLHSDHLGSTVLTTDTSNNPTGDQRYYAYGKQRDLVPVATDHQFTGQKLDGTGLQYYNARYYDPTLGTFISPDSIVPDPGTLIDYNRYAYSRANPLKYNDPSGHCPWCITAGIGAAIGGANTGATYMLTTDYSNWHGSEIATVVGAGALAGGLIGSGIGAAAGTVQMSAALAMASSAAVASGSGAIATAEAYMAVNYGYSQPFDKSDFAVSTGTAAVEGAVNSLVPGSGLAAGATRAGISAAFGATDYLGRNYANGTSDESTASGAVSAALLWGAGSATGDLFSGGFNQVNPLRLRNPITSKDWTPTIWLDQKLNDKLIWEGVKEMYNDTLRPIGRNTAILFGWANADKEAGQ